MSELEKPQTPSQPAQSPVKQVFTRFSLLQRSEHALLLVSFALLGLTGLVQKYAMSTLSQGIIYGLGGLESVRIIHRVAAVGLMIATILHVIDLLYRIFVLRVRWTMMPLIDDFLHLIDDLKYYFGMRKRKANYGQYNYAEKMEYLAVVWGTLLMGVTGFMMWNPIVTTRYLPGQFIAAAKAAHGAEAVLAVAAIFIWHFYNVHLRHFNRSMFTGKMTRQEMEHEHPAELSILESEKQRHPIPAKDLRKRQRIFFPIAVLLAGVMSFGAYAFVTIEVSAISEMPQEEKAQVYVPVTPTPRPTSTPAPTRDPNQPVGAITWKGNFSALFDNRCGMCHGLSAVGGLSLRTYAGALQGGNSGPGIVPNDPEKSMVVKVQSLGGHPGQLTPEEIAQVVDWINSGAPEE